MLKSIEHNGIQLAIVIKNDYSKDGIEFFTKDDKPFQMGYMAHKEGDIINAHSHNNTEKIITANSEVLVIKKGKMRLDLYTQDGEYVESIVLEKGDIVLLQQGGHGFKCLENAEMIEVKQGPYLGDIDKVCYKGITDNEVVIND